MFSPQEQSACQELTRLALAEDLGEQGDVTSAAVIPENLQGRAVFLVKATGVVAGLPAAEQVMKTVDAKLRFELEKNDGDRVTPGDRLAAVSGSMRSILAAERTALNFLQHLSGIATLTRQFVDAVVGTSAKILDTRKTLPGWRLLEKYAVRQGGGHNHRMGLYDGILIKDNHLAALPVSKEAVQAKAHATMGLFTVTGRFHPSDEAEKHVELMLKIEEAVRLARTRFPDLPIEIEVDSVMQAAAAFRCQPQIVLLDNMNSNQLSEAARLRDQTPPRALLEASGGVNLQTVRAIAETGVDRISVGALTHSAPALDIALEYSS
jgi:nicotinate-nucleotide pyrophosphorylase (carboxylating)